MTSAHDTPSTGLGLFQSFFHAPNFSNFAAATPQPAEQIMRGFVRWQLELQGLMFRRAQAYLELPGRISQCRTPQDLMTEQQSFLQTMYSHYTESSQNVMTAWAQMFQLPVASPETSRSKGERDYLSFPGEQRSLSATGSEDQAYTSRKVA